MLTMGGWPYTLEFTARCVSKRAESQIHPGKHLTPFFTKRDSFVIGSSSDDKNGRTVGHSYQILRTACSMSSKNIDTNIPSVGLGPGRGWGRELDPLQGDQPCPNTLEGARRGRILHLPGQQEHLLHKAHHGTLNSFHNTTRHVYLDRSPKTGQVLAFSDQLYMSWEKIHRILTIVSKEAETWTQEKTSCSQSHLSSTLNWPT